MADANSTCLEFASAGVVCYGVFFNYAEMTYDHPGANCSSLANFDPDITGIGVVISFGASAILTTVASIIAALLDHFGQNERSLLPVRWQPRNVSLKVKERCQFIRGILERLILNLADQQLVTGYALLICAWVKLSSNPVLENFDGYLDVYKNYPNFWLPNAQFALVVFLCMASSSSHLACVLLLREYMEAHPSAAKLRIALMVVFAAFLSVTISLASSLTSYFAYIIAMLFSAVYKADNIPGWLITLVFATCMAIPLVVILALFWICTLQLVPNFKDRARNKLRKVILSRLRRWFRLSKIWHSCFMRLVPPSWRPWCTKTFKRIFWFILLGNTLIVFIGQIVLAVISMVWIGLQRLATPPEFYSIPLCSLHGVAGNYEWASFGQLLPIILLLLPVLLAYGTYIEERDHRRKSTYSTIPSSDLSPTAPRQRHSRRNTYSSPYHQDGSELELLDPQSSRQNSGATSLHSLGSSPYSRPGYARHDSQGSIAGLGLSNYEYWYRPGDVQSPMPSAHPTYQAESYGSRGRGGSMGWPYGYTTGIDEERDVIR